MNGPAQDGTSQSDAACRFGRPKKLNVEQRDLAVRLRAEGKSVKEVANICGVHVSTIYRLADLGIA